VVAPRLASAGFCGDNTCQTRDGETTANCPQDCRCGDGCCDYSEYDPYCVADCQNLVAGVCGNGCRNTGEDCDTVESRVVGGQICGAAGGTGACRWAPPHCGNAVLETGEMCDNGSNNSDLAPNACRTTCRFPYCSDHVVDTGEVCDDGNLTNGDGCDQNCTPTGCGNGVISPTEVCDDHNTTDGDGCDRNCTPTGCGNGVLTTGESCDDGNTVETDGCRATCVPNVCGDGVVNPRVVAGVPAEACDDGNTLDGDGCSYDCRKDLTACGDQALQRDRGEVCDFGYLNTMNPDAMCRPDCDPPRCGDTVTDVAAGETCDRTAGCDPLCGAGP
jgi:cysteine-rich repeat protein